ncbi:hypothetical protein BV898_15676 [Hypsibius exemplaris]|uniref:SP-RING-type domain-containing protein n=1 Tax=Hypsibius exemplaris TaxID=2072580 RepID=A0A9X6RKG4_HYPEX|nr:hypothetical protein BV898_15676 [Hypsibius exemplaris]
MPHQGENRSSKEQGPSTTAEMAETMSTAEKCPISPRPLPLSGKTNLPSNSVGKEAAVGGADEKSRATSRVLSEENAKTNVNHAEPPSSAPVAPTINVIRTAEARPPQSSSPEIYPASRYTTKVPPTVPTAVIRRAAPSLISKVPKTTEITSGSQGTKAGPKAPKSSSSATLSSSKAGPLPSGATVRPVKKPPLPVYPSSRVSAPPPSGESSMVSPEAQRSSKAPLPAHVPSMTSTIGGDPKTMMPCTSTTRSQIPATILRRETFTAAVQSGETVHPSASSAPHSTVSALPTGRKDPLAMATTHDGWSAAAQVCSSAPPSTSLKSPQISSKHQFPPASATATNVPLSAVPPRSPSAVQSSSAANMPKTVADMQRKRSSDHFAPFSDNAVPVTAKRPHTMTPAPLHFSTFASFAQSSANSGTMSFHMQYQQPLANGNPVGPSHWAPTSQSFTFTNGGSSLPQLIMNPSSHFGQPFQNDLQVPGGSFLSIPQQAHVAGVRDPDHGRLPSTPLSSNRSDLMPGSPTPAHSARMLHPGMNGQHQPVTLPSDHHLLGRKGMFGVQNPPPATSPPKESHSFQKPVATTAVSQPSHPRPLTPKPNAVMPVMKPSSPPNQTLRFKVFSTTPALPLVTHSGSVIKPAVFHEKAFDVLGPIGIRRHATLRKNGLFWEVIATFPFSRHRCDAISPNTVLLFRFCPEVAGLGAAYERHPEHLKLMLNGRTIVETPLPPDFATRMFKKKSTAFNQPIEVTLDRLVDGQQNIVMLRWTEDATTTAPGQPPIPSPAQHFHFVGECARRKSMEEVLKALTNGRVVPTKESVFKLFKALAGSNDGDVLMDSQSMKFSLHCPASRSRLGIPVRGRNCDHVDCFDAASFLMMNAAMKARWSCPKCSRSVQYDEMVVDQFTQTLLTMFPDLDSVEITVENGEIVVREAVKSAKDGKPVGRNTNGSANAVTHHSSNPSTSGRSAAGASKPPPEVIDLD